MTKEQRDALEELVDATSMYDVVTELAELCGEKAEHVRSAWQDEALAKAWERNGETLDKATGKLHP